VGEREEGDGAVDGLSQGREKMSQRNAQAPSRFGPVAIILAAVAAISGMAGKALGSSSAASSDVVILVSATIIVLVLVALAILFWLLTLPAEAVDPAGSVEQRLRAFPPVFVPEYLVRLEAAKLFRRNAFQGWNEGDYLRGYFAVMRTVQVWDQQIKHRLSKSRQSAALGVHTELNRLKQLLSNELHLDCHKEKVAEAAATFTGDVNKFVLSLRREGVSEPVGSNKAADVLRFEIMKTLRCHLEAAGVEAGLVGEYITPTPTAW
jgi:hypothetical protein